MNTKNLETVYHKIADKIAEIIPENWDKVYIYAEVNEFTSEVYFYFYPQGKETPIYFFDIIKLYDMDKKHMDELRYELNGYFEKLWQEFKNNAQEVWTNLTFVLHSSGKFNIDYGYEDLSEADMYEQHIIWRFKYLGIKPSLDRVRDNKIIDKYLKSLALE